MSTTSDSVTIADLARSLGSSPSVVLEACRLVGIEAAWAGHVLTGEEADVLRAHLGESDGPSEDEPARAPAGGSGGADRTDDPSTDDAAVGDGPALAEAAGPLPPTAVGSVPELVEAAEAPAVATAASAAGPVGFAGARRGDDPAADEASGRRTGTRSSSDAEVPLDPSLRVGIGALGLAVVALVVGEVWGNPLAVFLLWVCALLALVTSLLAAKRARYRIATRPEKHRGMGLSIGLLAIGLVIVLLMGLGSWVAVRRAPAADAPLGIGSSTSVQQLRWGYHRVQLIRRNGWHRPAREVDDCLEATTPDDEGEIGASGRDDLPFERVACRSGHDAEVLAVYSYDRDVDARYDAEHLRSDALARCAEEFAAVVGDRELVTEIPTEEGWRDADHDVTCILFGSRSGPDDAED